MSTSGSEKLLWDDGKFSTRSSPGERLTSVYGEKLVQRAGVPEYSQDKPLIILDNACGTGVVTQALQDILKDRPADTFEVTCGDFADAMLASATQRIQSSGWKNTTVSKVDAQDTKLPSDHFTHVLTNFGPMIFPNASAMLEECRRMLQPQGICAFTTWKKIGWLDDVREAFGSMPDLPPLEPEKFGAAFSKGKWWDAEWIRDEMVQHGFQNVKIEAVPNTSVAHDLEELRSLLSPIISIVYTFWTAEERERFANSETEQRIEKWFDLKYHGGPVTWDWVALITTSNK